MVACKIIGFGVVGKNMHKRFTDAIIHDPGQFMYSKDAVTDIAFICVPTAMMANGSADTSIVEHVIQEHQAKFYVVKSTVPPGTCEELATRLGKHVVFSPEYYGGTIHANTPEYNFTILGGAPEDTHAVASLLTRYYHPEHRFVFTDSRSAELVKYMENTWLALKVTFCNEMFRIAQTCGVAYQELRELFLMDPRVNRSHTFVYEDQPYYDSHCLNKDVPALVSFCEKIGYDPKLIRQMIATNEEFKNGSI
jgi:UDPglucose 6-dehydrogenase